MKITILVAFVATAVLIFLSCNWFRSKKTISNPLLGEWKLDSVRSLAKDTNFFLTKAIVHDTGKVELSFTKDSIFIRSDDRTDTSAYSFDSKNNLTIKGAPGETLTFTRVNDSLASLASKDSMIFFLHKK